MQHELERPEAPVSSGVGLPMVQTWPVEPTRGCDKGVYSSGVECMHAMPYFWQRVLPASLIVP